MKTLYYLISIAIVLVSMSSCSQDDKNLILENAPYHPKTQVEANFILRNYIILLQNSYSLKLSIEEAHKLGISSEQYSNAIDEVSNTNKLIKEAMINPKYEMQLTDPQTAIENQDKWPINNTRSSMPSGSLSTSGQEFAQEGFFAPVGMKGVVFVCRTNAALLPVYTCKTNSLNTWKIKTAVGTLGTNTTVTVPLAASNTNAGVYFSTTDSNGGMAYYQGY